MLRYVNCGLSVESIRLSISRFVIKRRYGNQTTIEAPKSDHATQNLKSGRSLEAVIYENGPDTVSTFN